MEGSEKPCRLCLGKVSNSYVILDSYKAEKLKTLSLDLDLTRTNEPIVCPKCLTVLEESFDFKTTCLINEDFLGTFVHDDSNIKLTLEEIVQNTKIDAVKSEGERVCRFCLRYLDCGSFVKNIDGDIFLNDMLQKCLPELDLSIVNCPLMCYDCMKKLQNQFNFIIACIDVEEKIRNIIAKDGGNNSVVDLNNVLRFVENANNGLCVKLESVDECTKEEIEEIGEKEIEIKTDDISFFNAKETEPEGAQQLLRCSKCSFVATNAVRFKLHNNIHVLPGKNTAVASKPQKYSCPHCPYKTNVKRHLNSHKRVHKDESELTVYNCKMCSFSSKLRGAYVKHLDVHRDKIVGSKLVYTRDSKHPRKFKATSTDGIELSYIIECTTFKCTLCPYTANCVSNIKCHLPKHLPKKAARVYNCSLCDHVATTKSLQLAHMLEHKEISVKVYRCEQCSYVATNLQNMRRHEIVHKDESEVKMHQCTMCSFRTKHLSPFRRHTRRHTGGGLDRTDEKVECGTKETIEAKNKKEIRESEPQKKKWEETKTLTPALRMVYRCKMCPLETSHRKAFRRHCKTHPQDVTFLCMEGDCEFESKSANSFRNHMLVHNDTSAVTAYMCQKCSYVTKYKESMDMHVERHIEPPQNDIFKCYLCEYTATIQKDRLDHCRRHVKPVTMKIYECEECGYETKQEYTFNKHRLIHKKEAERTTNCKLCGWQFASMKSSIIHMKWHKERDA